MDSVRRSLRQKLTALHRSIANSETGKNIGLQRQDRTGISDDFSHHNELVKALRTSLKRLRDAVDLEKRIIHDVHELETASQLFTSFVNLAQCNGLCTESVVGPEYFDVFSETQLGLKEEDRKLVSNNTAILDSEVGSIEYELSRAKELKAAYYNAVEWHESTVLAVETLARASGREASTKRMLAAQHAEQAAGRRIFQLERQTMDKVLEIFASAERMVLECTGRLLREQLESKQRQVELLSKACKVVESKTEMVNQQISIQHNRKKMRANSLACLRTELGTFTGDLSFSKMCIVLNLFHSTRSEDLSLPDQQLKTTHNSTQNTRLIPNPVRLYFGEIVRLRVERVLQLNGTRSATPGLLIITNHRLIFTPYAACVPQQSINDGGSTAAATSTSHSPCFSQALSEVEAREATSPEIQQAHTFSASELQQTPTADAVESQQAHTISASELQQTPTADAVESQQAGTISASELQQTPTAEATGSRKCSGLSDGSWIDAVETYNPQLRESCVTTVLYDFFPEDPDEVCIQAGESVNVIKECNDGWILVFNSAGEQGVVPKSYLADFVLQVTKLSISSSGCNSIDVDGESCETQEVLCPSATQSDGGSSTPMFFHTLNPITSSLMTSYRIKPQKLDTTVIDCTSCNSDTAEQSQQNDSSAIWSIPLMCLSRIERTNRATHPNIDESFKSQGTPHDTTVSTHSHNSNALLHVWTEDLFHLSFSLRHTTSPPEKVEEVLHQSAFKSGHNFPIQYQSTLEDYLLRHPSTQKTENESFNHSWPPSLTSNGWNVYNPLSELSRQTAGTYDTLWRISEVNQDYHLCASYPRRFIVPQAVNDEMLVASSKCRTKGRLPIVTWVSSQRNTLGLGGVALLRSSQPTGVIGGSADALYLDHFRSITVFDCRPKLNAFGNVAIGGGWEARSRYKNTTLQFLGMQNIHVIRGAFVKLRGLFSFVDSTIRYSHNKLSIRAVGRRAQGAKDASGNDDETTEQKQQCKNGAINSVYPRNQRHAQTSTLHTEDSSTEERSAEHILQLEEGMRQQVNLDVSVHQRIDNSKQDDVKERNKGATNKTTSGSVPLLGDGGGGNLTQISEVSLSQETRFKIVENLLLKKYTTGTRVEQVKAKLAGNESLANSRVLYDVEGTLIRQTCGGNASAIANCSWLDHVATSLNGAVTVSQALDDPQKCTGSAVLVHCSDGWDRTSHVIALAQLLIDPYYRTLAGFEVLVEKEWCGAGHKFATRHGHQTMPNFPDNNEESEKVAAGLTEDDEEVTTGATSRSNFLDKQRSPVFLLFLDAVWQVMKQFPNEFQFKSHLLNFIYHESLSCRFGTFLGNSEAERIAMGAPQRMRSIWTEVNSRATEFLNLNYASSRVPPQVLRAVVGASAQSVNPMVVGASDTGQPDSRSSDSPIGSKENMRGTIRLIPKTAVCELSLWSMYGERWNTSVGDDQATSSAWQIKQ